MSNTPEISNMPVHVGIIMDGNRRWAKERGLPSLEGHRRGYDQAITIAEHVFNSGIKYLTLFAFSTENWNRSAEEVSYLMDLLLTMIRDQSKRMQEQGIRLKVVGTRERLSPKILDAITEAENLTITDGKGTLLLAFNYGGRPELVGAVKSIVQSGVAADSITEQTISDHVYTAGIPDPDLIIRTSGEHRISGFLLWQAAYSELYFTNKYWPDFSPQDLDAALQDFSGRQRRFGR